MIICCALRNAHFFKLCGNGFLGFLNGETCKFLGIDELIALAEIVALFKCLFGNVYVTKLIIAVDDLYHIDVMGNGVLEVTLVVGGYSHNCTCAVACKNEVADEHSDFLAVYGIYAGNALELAA